MMLDLEVLRMTEEWGAVLVVDDDAEIDRWESLRKKKNRRTKLEAKRK